MRPLLEKDQVAKALELMVGEGKSPDEVSKILNRSYAIVCRWMTLYWFYKKPNDPVVITLKSKV